MALDLVAVYDVYYVFNLSRALQEHIRSSLNVTTLPSLAVIVIAAVEV